MSSCQVLKAYARICGKNAKTGINPDVYLIAFGDLAPVAGSTEVFTEGVTGLITEVGLLDDTTNVFVKFGSVLNQGSIKEDYTGNDNGTYDVVKQLVFTLLGMGSVEGRSAVENLFGQPIAALVKLNSGAWIIGGLNGQMALKTSSGTVDTSNNARTLTLSGSDTVLWQTVDPTIISGLITLND
jgi:hypothetical protein